MNLKLEEEFSKADILKEVDALKKQIDDMRPLPEDIEGRVMQKLRLDWNYNSNAIEGNKLSYGETVAFLMEGITAKGKPLKDHLDIRGHNNAINFLLDIVKDTRPISEADIRALHAMILVEPYDSPAKTADGLPTTKRITLGEYKTSPNHVKTATGEIHYYATAEETPVKMQELMEWYTEVSSNKSIHPVVTAALFHYKFVAIHPFDDGNGRLSRILMNLILMQKGFPPVVVKMDDRKNYYSLLSRADVGDNWPFVEYIVERLQSSLQLFLKAAKGGDIDEDEDIDKEIELLKMQLHGGFIAREKKSANIIKDVFLDSIFPLAIKIDQKTEIFKEYFFNAQNWLRFHYVSQNIVSQNLEQNSNVEYIRDHLKDEYIKRLTDSTREITEVDIEMDFDGYKNPENSFNVIVKLKIEFEIFYYKIFLNNELLVSKLYHEKLLVEDQNKIVKYVIQDFKYQLNDQQKSPKP